MIYAQASITGAEMDPPWFSVTWDKDMHGGYYCSWTCLDDAARWREQRYPYSGLTIRRAEKLWRFTSIALLRRRIAKHVSQEESLGIGPKPPEFVSLEAGWTNKNQVYDESKPLVPYDPQDAYEAYLESREKMDD
jgi:hypothetical protein